MTLTFADREVSVSCLQETLGSCHRDLQEVAAIQRVGSGIASLESPGYRHNYGLGPEETPTRHLSNCKVEHAVEGFAEHAHCGGSEL